MERKEELKNQYTELCLKVGDLSFRKWIIESEMEIFLQKMKKMNDEFSEILKKEKENGK